MEFGHLDQTGCCAGREGGEDVQVWEKAEEAVEDEGGVKVEGSCQ